MRMAAAGVMSTSVTRWTSSFIITTSPGLLTMIVQEFIDWDHYVRCMCIGQEHVLPMKYDPRERRYHVEHAHLSPELGERVVQ